MPVPAGPVAPVPVQTPAAAVTAPPGPALPTVNGVPMPVDGVLYRGPHLSRVSTDVAALAAKMRKLMATPPPPTIPTPIVIVQTATVMPDLHALDEEEPAAEKAQSEQDHPIETHETPPNNPIKQGFVDGGPDKAVESKRNRFDPDPEPMDAIVFELSEDLRDARDFARKLKAVLPPDDLRASMKRSVWKPSREAASREPVPSAPPAPPAKPILPVRYLSEQEQARRDAARADQAKSYTEFLDALIRQEREASRLERELIQYYQLSNLDAAFGRLTAWQKEDQQRRQAYRIGVQKKLDEEQRRREEEEVARQKQAAEEAAEAKRRLEAEAAEVAKAEAALKAKDAPVDAKNAKPKKGKK